MQITSSLPTTENRQAFLCATVPSGVPGRAKGYLFARETETPIWPREIGGCTDIIKRRDQTPYVVFTLASSCTLSPAQQAVVNRPDTQVERASSLGEVLYESVRDVTYA